MSSCDNCAVGCGDAGQAALNGRHANREDFVVALAGNPNTGKSTVFNHLTGLRQHTGNWPGKTVARAEGTFTSAGRRFRLVDLPGTYSLLARSIDEEVARDFVLFGRPDCTVVVCDATILERNLHLVLQVLEITDRVVVCVNLIDEADRKQIAFDARVLERELGVPVVPTAAREGRGIDQLVSRISDIATGSLATRPAKVAFEPEVQSAIDTLSARLLDIEPTLPCPRWIAIRLLDGDERIEQLVAGGELAKLSAWPESDAQAGIPA